MARRPLVIAFDVVETLFSLEPLRDRIIDTGQPGHVLELWFARLLRDAFALCASGGFPPVPPIPARGPAAAPGHPLPPPQGPRARAGVPPPAPTPPSQTPPRPAPWCRPYPTPPP